MIKRMFQGTITGVLLLVSVASAHAEDDYKLSIRDHRFDPTELSVPAGKKVKVVIENTDPTPEEFESYDLNREKIIPGGGKATVFLGPLKPGRYEFFGEFHKDTALGAVVVAE